MTQSRTDVGSLVEWVRTPESSRLEARQWSEALASLRPPIQRGLERLADQMGVSAATARRRYDAWRKGGRSWADLVDGRKSRQEVALHPDTIEHWRALCAENQRKCKASYRTLLRQFFAGKPIPGLDPGVSRERLPRGWGYHNLMRHRPSDYELRAARIGRGAAAELSPRVFSTRVGMSVGHRYVFDDLWHDFEVAVIGQRKSCRLLQLHALDLFSGCQFARGMKPRVRTDDGTSVGLTEDEMLLLVAHVLDQWGHHPEGTVLMVEHGTAAVAPWLEELLYDLSGGRVVVDRSGIQGASAFGGQYGGRAKGNFRFKAALESLGSLIHNETADMLLLPGQTGSNARLNAPEELHGRQRHQSALTNAMLALPAERRAQIAQSFIEAHTAIQIVDEISERINQRTDHDLEGWVEAGLTTVDFDLPGVGVIPGAKVLALEPARRAAVEAAAAPVARRLSPREVFDAGRRALQRWRPEAIAAILAKRLERKPRTARVRRHLIEIEDADVSPNPLRYLAHTFRDGQEFGVVVNPYSPRTCHLYDARGRWVGMVDAWQTVARHDVAALEAQMGAAAEIEAQLLAPVRARGERLTRERLKRAKANAETLGAAGRDIRDAAATADEIIGRAMR